MKAKSYSAQEVFNFAEISTIFEFFSTKESNFIVDDLSKRTSKNIILTNENYHIPTYSNAILIKEYEAKKSRYQLHLAMQNYSSMTPIIHEVTRWISESAETSHDTMMKVYLSFNHRHLETLQTISRMNPIRLVLKLDENFIYDRFPEQINSPYALSIKKMSPISTYINETELQQNINNIIILPQAEYYGIDFTDYTKGILQFNYIGGKNYAEKNNEIKEVLEYFVIKTYQSLNEEEYAPFELYEMKRITQQLERFQKSYYDPDIFEKEFPNIKVFADLKTSQQTIKTYWDRIRKSLFEMIIKGGLEQGHFNYDTDIGKIQLKEGKLIGTLLKNIEFFKCDLNGVFENCNFTSCNLIKSRIYNSKFIMGNKIFKSYLEGASINKLNEVLESYIVNHDEVVNCDIKESVIKFATPGKDITLDKSSIIIIKEEPLPKKSDAIEIDEIRDYSFIKSMRKNNDDGFGNIYNKNNYIKHNGSYRKTI
jgi:CRISPR/Cas system CMR-associated protein Cmr5 small subunit